MNTKKFVSLSDKSLVAAYEWAENTDDPLGQVYLAACAGCGSWMGRPPSVLKSPLEWRQYQEADRLFYEARDRIGRIVLNRIKSARVSGETK